MVPISQPVPGLSPESLTLYYTADPSLNDLPILIFHGPSTTTNSTLNSSRIQAHIFTPGGFQTYARLTVSPSSPLYAAVNHLPREQQGDEICRGLAVSLFKYFSELPEEAKRVLAKTWSFGRVGATSSFFDEKHAGDVAGRLVRVNNKTEVIDGIRAGLTEQSLSWVDIDLVLPPGSISRSTTEFQGSDEGAEDTLLERYGKYAPLIKLFGPPAFMPTSKLRRAPSRPTAVNRSRSFLKDQKESLRREMCEFVDTEERYVGKMYDLVHNVAKEFRQKAKSKGLASFSPNEIALDRLFPASLDRILQVNSSFLDAIRTVLDDTENEAIDDIQADIDGQTLGSTTTRGGRRKDVTGALAFAKVLLEWFPKFSDCYPEYVRASTEYPQILNGFLKDSGSSFSKRIHETGEQHIRSMLIEPVQRLPRYSLFIDNIVNLLPVSHSALNALLKARDLITDICSLDTAATDHSQTVSRLRNIITSWPPTLTPHGRLITATDILELAPPFRLSSNSESTTAGILLLFADCAVLLRKGKDSSISARGILAEVDRPSMAAMTASVTSQRPTLDLHFSTSNRLRDLRFGEAGCGRLISMTHLTQNHASEEAQRKRYDTEDSKVGVQMFSLLGSYEGKASRWTEDVAKARIEGRFPESEREHEKWALRSICQNNEGFGLFVAIFEGGNNALLEGRSEPAVLRIVVDTPKDAHSFSLGQHGIEIAVSLMTKQDGRYQLDVDGLGDWGTSDIVTTTELLQVLRARVGKLMQLQSQVQNPALTISMLSFYQSVLRSFTIDIDVEEDQPKFRGFRPPSPVKMLSNFLGVGYTRESGSPSKQLSLFSASADGPDLRPLPPSLSRTGSNKGIIKDNIALKVTIVDSNESNKSLDPTKRLEEVLASYVLALHVRRGNVVGKVLRSRAGADELAVNELYNTLLEDPSNHQVSAEVSIDVLFAAFEKFLNVAWKALMGPILAKKVLNSFRDNYSTMFKGDFEDHLRTAMTKMAPQNQRAFRAVIKLLADLLDASGNDGDRGALTATFAELLVIDGDPLEYIPLVDRLVEDSDGLFDDATPPGTSGAGTPATGSLNSMTRTRSANTESLSSNASSFRRRFGFANNNTLSRENNKSEAESKVGSVWRTLSKTARGGAAGEIHPASMSKASLTRSKSTDIDARVVSPSRPASRDRPTVLGAFSFEDAMYRPGNEHNNSSTLSTIGEGSSSDRVGSPRKKRRSSLSDLISLQTSVAAPTWSSSTPRKPNQVQQSPQQRGISPKIPLPSRGLNSPLYCTGSPSRTGTINRKENSPVTARNTLTERANNIRSDEIIITSYNSAKRSNGLTSGIPTLKGGLKERPTILNGADSTLKKNSSSSQKLRMQSPQKLRERLQSEQKAIQNVESTLQAELSKIGEEMSAISLRPLSSGSSIVRPPNSSDMKQLTKRFNDYECKIPVQVGDLTSRIAAIQKDVESSLLVSETKAKRLDELYREANAENEALYERFNEELRKVLKGVRGGEAIEEMKSKLKETQEEAMKLKKENQRLKRENLGLRSQLRGE
ncbi:MAG: hypothetical protein M1827_002438 [Pycnora praestabilis]|nr:MAG: hypothetical protein M1827_002438 [Pycnora praestabilis]